jgi:hypothetical protein
MKLTIAKITKWDGTKELRNVVGGYLVANDELAPEVRSKAIKGYELLGVVDHSKKEIITIFLPANVKDTIAKHEEVTETIEKWMGWRK